MAGYLEEEECFEIIIKVDSNSVEAKNNDVKSVIKAKRGIHHKYLQGVLDVVSFRY